MQLFESLNTIIQGYLPAEQIDIVKRAFVVARDAHEGQFRSSGEPYITHPVAVACIIAEMKLDHEAVMAALLHDVIEDTPYTLHNFSSTCAKLCGKLFFGVRCIFNHIVQQPRHNRFVIQLHFGNNARHRHRMCNIRLTA